MEPTDQLDAPNRRLPEGRIRRFAERKPASRQPSNFLVNHFTDRTSWLALALEARFWRLAGTILGTILKSAPNRGGCARSTQIDRDWPPPLSLNQSPDPFGSAQHHGVGRLPLRFSAAGGHRSPQACGHRPAARARVDVPFDYPTTSGRQLAVQIPRQLEQQCAAARGRAGRNGHFSRFSKSA
jgi:hypothetical protein